MKFPQIFLFLFFIILLPGCHPDPSSQQSPASSQTENSDIQSPEEEEIESIDPNHENIKEKKNWTFLFYAALNNNRVYECLETLKGIYDSYQGGGNVLIFVDKGKLSNDTTKALFGEENFSEPRVYQVVEKEKTFKRLDNGTLFKDPSIPQKEQTNSANILLLKKFIEYAKENYPANHYALFFLSHALAPEKMILSRQGEEERWIHTHEFTEKLSKEHSVDVLGLDVCFTGSLEFLYQIRKGNGSFHADYAVGTPYTSYGWFSNRIFQRISDNSPKLQEKEEEQHPLTGDTIKTYAGQELTPLQFAKILIEEYYTSPKTADRYSEFQGRKEDFNAEALYDLGKIEQVKKDVDTLFINLKDQRQNFPGMISDRDGKHDLGEFAYLISNSDQFSNDQRQAARALTNSLQELILYSCAGKDNFPNFNKNGRRNGIAFIFPKTQFEWENGFQWFDELSDKMKDGFDDRGNPIKIKVEGGNFSICKDGASYDDNDPGNYFEVIKYWIRTGQVPR